MRASDQTSPNAALIALRDKYRKLAIRVWDRFQVKHIEGVRGTILGFQARRDYYIYAAEAIGGMVGGAVSVEADLPVTTEASEVVLTLPPAANSEAGQRPEVSQGDELRPAAPASDQEPVVPEEVIQAPSPLVRVVESEDTAPEKIDSGLQPAAVATEEK
jgi:hypothetical protein